MENDINYLNELMEEYRWSAEAYLHGEPIPKHIEDEYFCWLEKMIEQLEQRYSAVVKLKIKNK